MWVEHVCWQWQIKLLLLVDWLHRLGRLQRKLGHWQEALETYERAVRRRPAPPEAHAGLARCRLHEGDAQGAADALRPVAASSDPEVVELRTAIEARLAGSRR